MKSPVVQFQIMRLWLTTLVMAFALNGSAFAQHPSPTHKAGQDPTKQLPKSFHLEFENEWVRVVRVHYDAKANLPEHEHPEGATVYLYLNASDGVVFQHDDGSAPVPRPPVLPGAIRSYVAPLEHHSVTNNADAPSDFIRILLKTEVPTRIARPNTRMSPSVMAYDHAMLHIQRINVEPRTKARVEAKNYPVFRIALIPDKTEWRVSAKEGYRFLEKGTTEEFEVSGNVPMQLLTIELRTPIAKPR
jgi:hypothetical protein